MAESSTRSRRSATTVTKAATAVASTVAEAAPPAQSALIENARVLAMQVLSAALAIEDANFEWHYPRRLATMALNRLEPATGALPLEVIHDAYALACSARIELHRPQEGTRLSGRLSSPSPLT